MELDELPHRGKSVTVRCREKGLMEGGSARRRGQMFTARMMYRPF